MKTKTHADKKKPDAAEPILVFMSHGREPCGHCHTDLAKGAFIVFKNEKPACHKCGGLSGLVFLPSGEAALTRRAKNQNDPPQAPSADMTSFATRQENSNAVIPTFLRMLE